MKFLIAPLLVVAFAAGFFAGRPTAPDAIVAAATPPPQSPVATSVSADAPCRGELASLRETAKRQDDRIRELERQVRETPVVVGPDPMAPAAELWDLARTIKQRPRSEDKLRMMKLFGELKPDHAAFFIAKYRDSDEAEARQLAMMCTSMSGGPDASNFIAGLLGDASVDERVRREALRALSGGTGMPVRFAMTEALAQAGERMLSSPREEERAAAAGILGWKTRDDWIEQTLRMMAESDGREEVRSAAALALGHGGSRETLAWLKALRERIGPGNGMMQWHLDQAIAELEHN